MWQETFSHRLIELRKLKNLSQTDLGSIIGLSKQAVSDMERGKRSTTMDTYIALADYFDVSLDYLIGLTDNPQSHKS